MQLGFPILPVTLNILLLLNVSSSLFSFFYYLLRSCFYTINRNIYPENTESLVANWAKFQLLGINLDTFIYLLVIIDVCVISLILLVSRTLTEKWLYDD